MTKKNKKVVAIISILFVIIYSLSSALIFILSRNSEVDKFDDFAQQMMSYNNIEFYSGLTAVEFMAELTDLAGLQNRPYYPYIAALYGADGEIVAQTGSFLMIPEESESYVNRIHRYYFIDEYLTKEKKKEITRFLKNINYMVDVSEFNYYKNGDEIIPVSVTVNDPYSEKPFENTVKIILSDKEITHTYKLEYEYDEYNNIIHSNMGYYVTFIDYDENSRYHKIYKNLKEIINNNKEKAIEYLENGNGGGGSIGSDFMNTFDTHITLADGVYSFLAVAAFNSVTETLLSESFIAIMAFQTVFFALFYILLISLLTVHYKRSRKIEEAKIAFTSAAAHELKTPLAVIENQCECIMESIAPEKNEEYVKSIYYESLRMNKLVATLLQYNRLASAESIKKEKCDLAEIVSAEIEKYRPLIESKNILLETYISKNRVEINCNKELIALVIDNYLSNAIKHTDANKRIVVTLSEDTFSVFNSGQNIKPELEKNLWDIFYRDDEARNSEDNSTGMGLAICKQILEHHKFKYGFVNKPDGVEFYFKIS